ncbi:NAD-dependent epimerase/dehydratase family protein [Streptomyces agglomeratus]|uniref:NAD-dependent epimerase/dehydratase family protein n=1 Tax=Streptomyces agglomeratus TaxID=285458 RepID=UPI00210C2B4E|nr:NAD-dependent epimerase/dehydratase family protein [Streptomyces agglomeratus]
MKTITGATVPAADGPRILVTGATGFIGSAVLRDLAARHGGTGGQVRALVRNVPRPRVSRPVIDPGIEYVQGDVTDPESLRGVCDGIDVLIHLACYIGPDERLCTAVNELGTHAVLAEAARAGTRRVLTVSPTAVYGGGPHRSIGEHDVVPAPVSPTSRSRLLAERAVLAAGGAVLRPGLVYGTGDEWVVPAVAELLGRVPAWCDGGRALLSVIAVDDLARLLTTAAMSYDPVLPPGTVHHASHPEPVSLRDLLIELCLGVGLPLPQEDLTYDEYCARLAAVPGRVTERQLSLLATDHWYGSCSVWQLTGCLPGPGFQARMRAYAPWYRAFLDQATRPAPPTPPVPAAPRVPHVVASSVPTRIETSA